MTLEAKRYLAPVARYVLLSLVFLCARTVSAHEGPPFPLFVDQKVEPYVVSVWTDPDVGTALFFVIVQQPAVVPADLKVQIGVQPASGRLPETLYSCERETVQGNIQYRAQVHFDAQELWQVRVRLESAAGNAETFATVEATPPGYGRWDLLLYLLPFLAIGILWVIAMVHKIKRRTGDNHA
jgi:hypothetical protein